MPEQPVKFGLMKTKAETFKHRANCPATPNPDVELICSRQDKQNHLFKHQRKGDKYFCLRNEKESYFLFLLCDFMKGKGLSVSSQLRFPWVPCFTISQQRRSQPPPWASPVI